MSHRSKEFVAIASEAEKNLRDILDVPAEYKVCFFSRGSNSAVCCSPVEHVRGKNKSRLPHHRSA